MSDNGKPGIVLEEESLPPDVQDVDATSRKRPISYGELRRQHDMLKKIHDSTNKAVEDLHKRLDAANLVAKVAAEQRENANANAANRKLTLDNAIQLHNEQKTQLEAEVSDRARIERELRAEIKGLRAEIKELKGGYLH